MKPKAMTFLRMKLNTQNIVTFNTHHKFISMPAKCRLILRLVALKVIAMDKVKTGYFGKSFKQP